MYITDNNLRTLQDVVNHITAISKAEAVICNEECIISAICYSPLLDECSFCFQDRKVYEHCNQFLMNATNTALSNENYSGLCWAGIRFILKKVKVENKVFYISLDKFVLDKDVGVFDDEKAKEIIDNNTDLEHIRSIYYGVPILTSERLNKLLYIMHQCLQELDSVNYYTG